MIVDFMKQNEEVFNAYIFGESFKAHCQQMENLGEWGTQAEIFAIATLLKINIFFLFLHGIAQRAISLALLQAYYYSPMCNKQSIQAVLKKDGI